MAEYRSSHSGTEIDEAVTMVLNGTAGLQGFKFLGNEIIPDVNNKVDLSWDNFVTKDFWTPTLGATDGTDPECTYEYQKGQYVKIGYLCYISFETKLKIDTVNVQYACIKGLPYYADYLEGDLLPEYALSIGELSQSSQNTTPVLDLTGQLTMIIHNNTNFIALEHRNGIHSIELVADNSNTIYIRGSGFYITKT